MIFTGNATEDEINKVHKYVSETVKKIRLEKGISQLELALTIGMKSGAFFGNAETNANGKHFNIEHIYKIAKALDRRMSDFLPKSPIAID